MMQRPITGARPRRTDVAVAGPAQYIERSLGPSGRHEDVHVAGKMPLRIRYSGGKPSAAFQKDGRDAGRPKHLAHLAHAAHDPAGLQGVDPTESAKGLAQFSRDGNS